MNHKTSIDKVSFAKVLATAKKGDFESKQQIKTWFKEPVIEYAESKGIHDAHKFARSVFQQVNLQLLNFSGNSTRFAHLVFDTTQHQLSKTETKTSLAVLDPQQEKILALRVFFKLKPDQVAEALNITPKEVETLEEEIQTKLTAYLASQTEPDSKVETDTQPAIATTSETENTQGSDKQATETQTEPAIQTNNVIDTAGVAASKTEAAPQTKPLDKPKDTAPSQSDSATVETNEEEFISGPNELAGFSAFKADTDEVPAVPIIASQTSTPTVAHAKVKPKDRKKSKLVFAVGGLAVLAIGLVIGILVFNNNTELKASNQPSATVNSSTTTEPNNQDRDSALTDTTSMFSDSDDLFDELEESETTTEQEGGMGASPDTTSSGDGATTTIEKPTTTNAPQIQNASISGQVRHLSTNSAASNVTVTFVNTATNARLTANTTSQGNYSKNNLTPGTYRVYGTGSESRARTIKLSSGQNLSNQRITVDGLLPEAPESCEVQYEIDQNVDQPNWAGVEIFDSENEFEDNYIFFGRNQQALRDSRGRVLQTNNMSGPETDQNLEEEWNANDNNFASSDVWYVGVDDARYGTGPLRRCARVNL